MNDKPRAMKSGRIKQSPSPLGHMDDLAAQIVIRKRYATDWPNTILQLTKRIHGTTTTWLKIVQVICSTEGLSVTFTSKPGVGLVIRLEDNTGSPAELIELDAIEIMKNEHGVEVMLMDALAKSETIKRHMR